MILYRRKFPIVINCWFCQANCKVPYDNLNSFICYACEQYNGFKEVCNSVLFNYMRLFNYNLINCRTVIIIAM